MTCMRPWFPLVSTASEANGLRRPSTRSRRRSSPWSRVLPTSRRALKPSNRDPSSRPRSTRSWAAVWVATTLVTGGASAGGLTQAALTFAAFSVIVGLGQLFVITLGPGNVDRSIPANMTLAGTLALEMAHPETAVRGHGDADPARLSAAIALIAAAKGIAAPPSPGQIFDPSVLPPAAERVRALAEVVS